MPPSSAMWNQSCRPSAGATAMHKAVLPQMSGLKVFPTTVSHLLSATRVTRNSFALCDWELNQVSIVGIVRGFAPFTTHFQISVDDMTAPPLNVKLWVNLEDPETRNPGPPGAYVKVIGSLRDFSGQRSLLAMDIRPITDPNEISSHMLEVVQAHMQLLGKVFDVNMNPTVAGRSGAPDGMLPRDQDQDQGQRLLGVSQK